MEFPKKNIAEASTTRTSSSANASVAAAPWTIDIGGVVERVNSLIALVAFPIPQIPLTSDLENTLDSIVNRLETMSKRIPGVKVAVLPRAASKTQAKLDKIHAIIKSLLAYPATPDASKVRGSAVKLLDILLAHVRGGAWTEFLTKNEQPTPIKVNRENDSTLANRLDDESSSSDPSFSSDSFDSNLIEKSLHDQISYEKSEKEKIADKYKILQEEMEVSQSSLTKARKEIQQMTVRSSWLVPI